MKCLHPKTCCIILLTLSIVVTVAGGAPQVEFTDSTGEVEAYDFAGIMIPVTNLNAANRFIDASVQGMFRPENNVSMKVQGSWDSADGRSVQKGGK